MRFWRKQQRPDAPIVSTEGQVAEARAFYLRKLSLIRSMDELLNDERNDLEDAARATLVEETLAFARTKS